MSRRLTPLLASALLLAFGCTTGQSSGTPEIECVREPDWVALDTWDFVIEEYEALDAENPAEAGSIVFVGSSSIWFWDTLAQDMAPIPSLNRGFGGSVIVQATNYVDRVIVPYEPSAVVLYAGDNDLAFGSTADCALLDFESFVKRVHAAAPQTPIYYISIKPSPARWELWEEMERANQLIEARTGADSSVHFVDVSDAMLDEQGEPIADLFVEDGLHLSAAGYELWTSIIRPRLAADLAF